MGEHPGSSATFGALGTYVYVATRDPGELAAARGLTEAVLAEVDRTCSRFREDSDLVRANAAAGHWVEVDPLLVSAVGVAVDVARATDGIVHPLLGRQLVSWGYDRDFGRLVDSGPATPPPAPGPRSWSGLGLAEDAIRVPEGTALDLGSTGKAFAADLVATTLAGELTTSAIVSVGGDLAVSRPDGVAWPVAVSGQLDEPAVVVWLERGGLATSNTEVRRWTRSGTAYHHLIDPRTGAPATTPWVTASCLGTTSVAANTASTAAIVLGNEATAWLAAHDVTARLVTAEGSVRRTGGWPADEEAAA
ncbi:FAD:protein FMN transferase [Nocardioides cynanchi]|uniref:FAD:protein FMN transferase n=1 Tax=Nocardioides cynanchi TaxID=2558918 RepID=UPI0012441AF4|nr:FAD:protein FMN transferase [Nocardioides cynanchi]